MTKPLKLTDLQLMLLSAASQREDCQLAPPEHLKGAGRKKIASVLLSRGLVEEVAVGRDDLHWHADEEEQPIGLRITAAGLQTIGVEEEPGTGMAEPREDSPAPGTADLGEPGTVTEPMPGNAREPRIAAQSAAPREGTKRALVIALLSREPGASIDELTTAPGWLPHTTRAALTGLRQSGYAITRTRAEDNRTVYHLAAAEPAKAQAAPEPAEV